ncbi:ATP-binding cassette domain-containing protein, partial [bacterium]|nr:ATP-binding cassette domain-containing protein [bacterium]
MSEAGPAAVRLQSISKRFGAVTALDSVSFEFQAGRVHALLGENGAGKSTLLSILYGLQQPDDGSIALFGDEVSRLNPIAAKSYGIAFVQQHFSLIPAFT